MRPVGEKIYLPALILMSLMGCRTVSSRDKGDILDGNTVRSGDTRIVDPGAEDDQQVIGSPSDASAMWSPASRRANAMYQFLVAEKLVQQGETAKAEAHFESSYNLDPNSFTGAQLVRAKILVDPKNPEGITEARRMSLLYPHDANLRLLFGQALIMTNDLKEGEIQLKRAIELRPSLEEAYVALIRCHQLQGQSDAAIDVARKMVKLNPSSIRAWSMLSRVLIGARKIKESLDPARRAWELQENNPELALIYALSLDLNKRGNEAVKLYEQLYRFNPGNSELVQRMVGLYKELGNLATALNLLDDMIENSHEEVPGLKMQKVIILWEMSRNDEALQVALDLQKSLPESDRVLYMAAVALVRVSRGADALGYYEKVQNESPLKIEAMKQQALLLKDLGKMAEALAVAETLCGRQDADAPGYLIWADLLGDDGKVGTSIEVIERAMTRFPDNKKLLFVKGVYQEKSGDKRGAESTMRLVIANDPMDASALNFLGYMLAEEGRELEEAESLVTRALKIQPENGGFVDSLGWIQYQRKMYKKALETLEKAVALEPNEGVIWEHLGDVWLKLDDKKKALEKYKEAVKRKNDPRDQDRMEGKIKSISSELSKGE